VGFLGPCGIFGTASLSCFLFLFPVVFDCWAGARSLVIHLDYDLRFTILFIPDNVGIRKAQRRIQADARGVMRAGRAGGPRQGFPCSLLPGFLSNRGPQRVRKPASPGRTTERAQLRQQGYD